MNPEMVTRCKSEQERASEQNGEQLEEQVSERSIEKLRLASDRG